MAFSDRLYRAISFVSATNSENYHFNVRSTKQQNTYPWKEALIDALIVAGMQFFYTLAGISAAQIVSEPIKALLAAGISAGLGFFTTLALKRGLKTVPQQ